MSNLDQLLQAFGDAVKNAKTPEDLKAIREKMEKATGMKFKPTKVVSPAVLQAEARLAELEENPVVKEYRQNLAIVKKGRKFARREGLPVYEHDEQYAVVRLTNLKEYPTNGQSGWKSKMEELNYSEGQIQMVIKGRGDWKKKMAEGKGYKSTLGTKLG